MISYREESVKEVLKAEYPRGMDVVYESGGVVGWGWDGMGRCVCVGVQGGGDVVYQPR